MGREMTTIKENPRVYYKAAIMLILAIRERQLPMNEMSCVNQCANISLIYRRVNFSLSFPLPGG